MSATAALLEVWRGTSDAAPEAIAVREAADGRAYTRGELRHLAEAAAASLPAALAQRRVVFAEPNGAGWFVRFLALLQVGAVPVPVDPTEPPGRQCELAAAIGAVGVWMHDGIKPAGRRVTRDAAAALIKLTSGSTGTPRAIRFTAAQMLADGRQVCSTMGIGPDDVNLAVIPCGHSYGLGNLVMPLLAQGTGILIGRAALPRVLAEDCERWRPTVFPAVPALLRILASSDVDAAAFSSLRTIISAGSPLPAATAQAFAERFGRIVHSFYGSSETGGISYDRTGEATLAGRSVGTPLDGVTLRPGSRGRMLVESAAVYTLGNRRIRSDGIGAHQPADRVEIAANGEVVLRGRAGRMVKVAGRRLDLADLERSLRETPGVVDAFAHPHPTRPEELAAALQTELGEREIRDALARRLPPWKVPRRLVLLKAFPLTARGKTDTSALRRLLSGA